MARTRSLKPQWRTSPTLKNLDDSARTLSAALITLADCYGNGDASVPLIASETWVVDEEDPAPTFAKAKRCIHTLWIAGFLDLYVVDGRTYFHLVAFPRCNKPKNPYREVPGPELGKIKELPGEVASVRNDSETVSESFPNESETVPESVQNDSETIPPFLLVTSQVTSQGTSQRAACAQACAPLHAPAHVNGKKPRPPSKLSEWRREAEALWERQEQLRADVLPRSRRLDPTEERLEAVAARLAGGASPEDCLAVLEHYAAEARSGGENGKWFNGETNWRKANFTRALGMVGAPKAAPSRVLTARDLLDLGDAIEQAQPFAEPEPVL